MRNIIFNKLIQIDALVKISPRQFVFETTRLNFQQCNKWACVRNP